MLGIIENTKNLINSHRVSDNLNILNSKVLSDQFSDIEIGASFNPEHAEIYNNNQQPISVLKYIVEDLQIKDIRLAFRWNLLDKGEFSFEYYKPYLDYCVQNSVNLVLNLGPIKTMRWPEEHIPESLTHLVAYKQTIDLEHPIALDALNHLRELCKYISSNYSDHLDKFKIIQCNNEFQNRFGVYKFLISHRFEVECIKISKEYFPESKFLLNSNGLLDIIKILNIIRESKNTEFILGVNYYYKVGGQNRIPILNKVDGLFLSKYPYITPKSLRNLAAEYNFQVEVSELQGEPWLPDAPTPGNSFKEFVFELLRVKLIKPENQIKLLCRYWGVEDIISKTLSGKDTKDNAQILNLIKQINLKKGLTR